MSQTAQQWTNTVGTIAEMVATDGVEAVAAQLGVEPDAVRYAVAYARIAGVERK